jgi:hypothetical protein
MLMVPAALTTAVMMPLIGNYCKREFLNNTWWQAEWCSLLFFLSGLFHHYTHTAQTIFSGCLS